MHNRKNVLTSFFKISYIATPSVLFEVILLMEYSTLVKEASAKVTVAKTVILINHLVENSVAFTLPITVTPVVCMLVTTVVLRSFSAALIFLFPSTIIFSSAFAADHFFAHVSQVKVTCFEPKWKQRCRKKWQLRKEVNFDQWTLKHNCQKLHLNQSALKHSCRKWHLNRSASWTGMWLDKQSFVFQILPVWFRWCAKWPPTILITLKIYVHQDDEWISNLCVKIQICA